jgi:hypothetical protein
MQHHMQFLNSNFTSSHVQMITLRSGPPAVNSVNSSVNGACSGSLADLAKTSAPGDEPIAGVTYWVWEAQRQIRSQHG